MTSLEKDPLTWTANDVGVWAQCLGNPEIEDMLKYHCLDGKDLLQLTDGDLRFDFKIKQVHDRKRLLREIADLKHLFSASIDVEFKQKVCSIRVHDIHSYTFKQLREDSVRSLGLPADKVVLRDKNGLIWAAVSVSCILDHQLRQQEPVYLAIIEEQSEDLSSESDSFKNEERLLAEEETIIRIHSITNSLVQLALHVGDFGKQLNSIKSTFLNIVDDI